MLPRVKLDPLASAMHTTTHRPVAMGQGSLSRSKQAILEPKLQNVELQDKWTNSELSQAAENMISSKPADQPRAK